VAKPDIEVKSGSNTILLNPLNNYTEILRYFNNNMPLLCKTVNIYIIFLQFQWSGGALLARPEHSPLLHPPIQNLPTHLYLSTYNQLCLHRSIYLYLTYPYQCYANFFHPRHTLICQTHDGTPQNFASRKGGTKLYTAINIYISTRMQAYENKTLHTHVE
jgi:hypothetical protein